MTYLLLLYKCFLNCFYIIIYLIRITNDLKQNIWYWRPIMYIMAFANSLFVCHFPCYVVEKIQQFLIHKLTCLFIAHTTLTCTLLFTFLSSSYLVNHSCHLSLCTSRSADLRFKHDVHVCVSVFTCQNAKERKLVNNLLF